MQKQQRIDILVNNTVSRDGIASLENVTRQQLFPIYPTLKIFAKVNSTYGRTGVDFTFTIK